MLDAYDMAIEGHNPHDVETAIRRFIRGEVPGHNQSFAPSASMLGGTIRQVMNDRLDSERRERDRRPALPPPDVVKSPESRARVRALADQCVADLTAQMLTPDAAADRKRRAANAAKVNARFDPQSEAEVRRRLGYTAGDPDGDRDVA